MGAKTPGGSRPPKPRPPKTGPKPEGGSTPMAGGLFGGIGGLKGIFDAAYDKKFGGEKEKPEGGKRSEGKRKFAEFLASMEKDTGGRRRRRGMRGGRGGRRRRRRR